MPVKCLLVDKRMIFNDQVEEVCRKVFSRLRSLWPSRPFFHLKTRLMLVKSLIVPAFTYGDCVYATNLRACDVKSLERAFSACVRFVYGLRRYDSTREHAHKILGCPIMTYIKQRGCSAIYSLAKIKTPPYLFDKLSRGYSSRCDNFIIPKHSTVQYNRSFFVRTVSDYNSLPVAFKRLSSLSAFNRACSDFFKTR